MKRVALALLCVAAAGPTVREPAGYWQGAMRSATPPTLQGARVIDADALDRLIATAQPLLIDVGPAPVRPAGLPVANWVPVHRTIPGAVWIPGAGAGDLSADRVAVLARRIATLTGGDRGRAIVTFCHPDCWASWNMGKRLVAFGYTRVRWFPAGIEGWQDRHPLAAVDPDAAAVQRSPE